jgi:hypothetical protein
MTAVPIKGIGEGTEMPTIHPAVRMGVKPGKAGFAGGKL